MPKVFLSYSHQDNEVPPDWVNTFYKDLSNYSKVYSGNHNLEIWKDTFNRDVRSESIEERIKQGLQGADILIALVSPSYLESWWSAFEREYFIRFVLNDKSEEIKKSSFEGASGKITFGEDGNRAGGVVRFFKVQGGKYVQLEAGKK